MTDWGALAAERLGRIAACSEPGPGVTRLPFTPEHRAALAEIRGWMEAAGLTPTLDAAGTLIGRREGDGPGTFYMGSHQDSVRHGGAYDGIMGVALACLAVQNLAETGRTLPFAVEVLAFADEEGVRFPTALIGPRALAGRFDPDVLTLEDRAGTTLWTAMECFDLDPDGIGALARDPEQAVGYLEAHIEQGPVLEQSGEALGVVTAICGIERHAVAFYGETGHAGTLPMKSRADALVGAADLISLAHHLGREEADLRVTVGQLDIAPNVVNAVPNEARLTLEIRSPDDAQREAAGQLLTRKAHEIAARWGLSLDMRKTYRQTAQPCDPDMRSGLTDAVMAAGGAGVELASGATHDASAMADLCPIAMLFLRCRGGVSHVPDEFASPADMGLAVEAMAHFLANHRPT
ncbi:MULTISPECIES: M20 family metallo-hydrolase [Maritimibacter]|uniref:N-carbamoyl-L-amino acid amidohydrolase n=1 Tax=Maritimibacter alkaliphilus HTCC2654 TaxID=314271 RepID=A3VKN8_9RHOB|nr:MULTISPECIES: M20 family metallo-hydrolase [Maritimibacter]EAQ11209.1 N-carbamoyl-L-amino acid amidohydrolase [Rhodobacterales bacterium HTCC2654] [Maritimibacter alkaliphilus HTCC2654]TYP83016.1 allantoate deiminase [Maritimibacter alkaliphilus HTCC2654]